VKALKFLAIGLGAVLALALVLMAAIAVMFDAAWVKRELASIVQEQKQRTLRIDGDVALSFWPSLGVRLGGVSLSEPRSTEEFAALDTARVSVALLPLLSKQIVVDRIELDGLRAILVKRRDGSLNIADLLSGGQEDRGAPMPVQVAGIRLGNATLTWRDEQRGKTTVVSGLDFATGPIAIDAGTGSYKVGEVSLAASAQSGTDSLALRVSTPGIEGNAQAVRLGKLDLEVDGRAGDATFKAKLDAAIDSQAGLKVLTIEPLAGSLDISHPQLPMKTLRLPISGRLRADLAKSSANVVMDSRLDASTIALSVTVSRFSPPAVAFALNVDQIDVDRYLPALQGSGTGKRAGKSGGGSIDASPLQGLDLQGTVSIGRLAFAGIETRNVRLQVNTRGGQLEYSGIAQQAIKSKVEEKLKQKAQENLQDLLFSQ
jgi:AsmA protein